MFQDTSDESHWQRLNRQIRYVSSVTNGKSDAVEGIVVIFVYLLVFV